MVAQQHLQRFSQQLAAFDDRLEWLRDADGQLDRTAALAELETCREELRVAEEELRAQHEELGSVVGSHPLPATNERLLNDLPVATLSSDRRGVLTAANRLAAQLLGEPAHQIVGKPLAAYVAGDRKPFRQLLGRLASGDRLDRLPVDLRVSPRAGRARSGVRAVLIARRDADSVKWVIVPEDDVVTRPSPADAVVSAARENAHVAIEALSMLPIATASMPDLLAAMERLAADTLPAAGRVTFALDRTPSLERRAETAASGQPFPLKAHGSGLGVMYVGDGPAGRLGPAERLTAQLFADAAGAVVSNVRALQESRDLVGHLSHALENRPIIEQAKGILMAVRNCDEHTAFDHLREISQQSNTKLHEVARNLVETMSTPTGAAVR